MGTLRERYPVRKLEDPPRYVIAGHYVLGILATTGDKTKRKMSDRQRPDKTQLVLGGDGRYNVDSI